MRLDIFFFGVVMLIVLSAWVWNYIPTRKKATEAAAPEVAPATSGEPKTSWWKDFFTTTKNWITGTASPILVGLAVYAAIRLAMPYLTPTFFENIWKGSVLDWMSWFLVPVTIFFFWEKTTAIGTFGGWILIAMYLVAFSALLWPNFWPRLGHNLGIAAYANVEVPEEDEVSGNTHKVRLKPGVVVDLYENGVLRPHVDFTWAFEEGCAEVIVNGNTPKIICDDAVPDIPASKNAEMSGDRLDVTEKIRSFKIRWLMDRDATLTVVLF